MGRVYRSAREFYGGGEAREEQGEEQDWEGFAGETTGWEEVTGGEGSFTSLQEDREGFTDPKDQYCSSCNQKRPLTDFGRFLTCNSCRQRNKRVTNACRAKHKASYIPPKVTQEQLNYYLQALSERSEFKLLLKDKTRPITIKDYINKKS
jgi:hypothetical protein